MAVLSKILLYGLPPALEKALLEQFETTPDVTVTVLPVAGKGIPPLPKGAAVDLVLYASEASSRQAPVFSSGIPVLPVDLGRPLRLGVILRQAQQMLEEPALHLDDFRIGTYLFKPQEKALVAEGREDIALTDKEADILVYLAKHAGTVSREELLKDVWRYQEGVDTHTLETHIYRLRQKIESSADDPALLVTDEGGYRLNI